jgi:hypothetical protein
MDEEQFEQLQIWMTEHHPNEDKLDIDSLKRSLKKLNTNMVLSESSKEHAVNRLESSIDNIHELTDKNALESATLSGIIGQLNIRMVSLEELMTKVAERFTYTKIAAFLIVIICGASTVIGIVYKYIHIVKIPAG